MIKAITDKLKIRLLYDSSSHTYTELYREEQFKKYSAIPRNYMPEEGSVVLDAGCGTGLLYEYFLINGYNDLYYVGIDISLGQLKNAKSRLKSTESMDLVYGDVDIPPFRDRCFSHIFSITHLQHSSNYKATVDTLKNLARGLIILSFMKKVFKSPPVTGEFYNGGVDWIVVMK